MRAQQCRGRSQSLERKIEIPFHTLYDNVSTLAEMGASALCLAVTSEPARHRREETPRNENPERTSAKAQCLDVALGVLSPCHSVK
ncbi:MAG TPA: hypothetical protein VFQ35_05590, partial [Polyangiaceae bacterium]|nr:hypothetical protein [Polyangiaceae bacterium]